MTHDELISYGFEYTPGQPYKTEGFEYDIYSLKLPEDCELIYRRMQDDDWGYDLGYWVICDISMIETRIADQTAEDLLVGIHARNHTTA